MDGINIFKLMKKGPHAYAYLKGSPDYPKIQTTVEFYQTKAGVIVSTYATGLPTGDSICDESILGMHIHSCGSCSGNETDYFVDAMTHYDPDRCPHPYHAGDMPPLFSVDGYAFSMFLTDRFSVSEILGKTIIIHSKQDDFTTQPAGDSGKKIACGVIARGRLI